MNATELKAKSADELQVELMALTKAQFGLRMQVATQQMTNTSEIRKVRRTIARIKTVMTQKGAQK
jgi:large subunit ribosomal protein L29